MFEKEWRCRSWSDIRGIILVLGGLHCRKLLCFFGDSFGDGGGDLDCWVGDWGLSVMSKVLSGFWGIGWLVGRG
jgi:hypothetical protein